MAKYIVKRLFAGLLTIVVLITTRFLMNRCRAAPSARMNRRSLPRRGCKGSRRSTASTSRVGAVLHYWKGLLRCDFGTSFKKPDTTANEIIFDHFPISAMVGGIAVAVSLLSGFRWASPRRLNRGRGMDWFSMAFAPSASPRRCS